MSLYKLAVISRRFKSIGYSVLTSQFPEKKEQVMAYAETAAGFGLLTGPILGGFLNVTFGY